MSSFSLGLQLWRFVTLASAVVVFNSEAAAQKPLAEAAKNLSGRLERGYIVTGEWRDGKASYSLVGECAEAKGTAPEDILFEIGSITKTFTGLLLAQAVVEKRVTLQTRIRELLDPSMKFADPRIGDITLVQLSTHTSGLPRLPTNHLSGVRNDDPYAGYDEKLLLGYLAGAKLKTEPPFPSSYSNLGAGLLGYLLGRVYGAGWEAAVLEKVCLPLGLNHTRITTTELNLPMAPPNSGKGKNRNWTFDSMAGAGALRSTAGDLIKYGKAVLNPESTRLREAFALALQPYADAPATAGRICLGFFIRERPEGAAYLHDGGTGGYTSAWRAVPKEGIVQVVLVNNHRPTAGAVLAGALPSRAPPSAGAPETPLSPSALSAFLGVYEVDQDTRFTVLVHEGMLWVRLTGQPFVRFGAIGPNQFFAKNFNAEIRFTRDNDAVTALTLLQDDEMNARRVSTTAPAITLRNEADLRPYVGSYSLMGLNEFTLTIRNSTLFAQLADQPACPVFEIAPDRFEYDVVEATLSFNRDKDGQVVGLWLHQNGMTLPAPKNPKKEAIKSAPTSATKK